MSSAAQQHFWLSVVILRKDTNTHTPPNHPHTHPHTHKGLFTMHIFRCGIEEDSNGQKEEEEEEGEETL